MAKYTLDEFTQAMKASVEERGADYVYPDEWKMGAFDSCVYTLEDGTPACIIGLAMSKLGAEMPSPDDTSSAHSLLAGLVEEDVADAAREAQVAQDTGKTWGEAFNRYMRALHLTAVDA